MLGAHCQYHANVCTTYIIKSVYLVDAGRAPKRSFCM
jgi:hypothetical protein